MNGMRWIPLVLAGAGLALSGCKEEAASPAYSRIPEVTRPETETAAAASPSMGSASSASSEASASPHGANPHAGMSGAGAGTMGIAPPPPVAVKQGGNILEAAGIAFTLPEGWKQAQPSSSMRLAQYELPGEAGAGELVLYYFGKGQGGDMESNIRRWAGQFQSDDPTTSTVGADVAQMERDGLRIALVKTTGTYNPGSMGPMMPASEPKSNYALFGLVIEGGPEGSLFVKATGPKATMDAQAKNLEAFAQSVRPSSYK